MNRPKKCLIPGSALILALCLLLIPRIACSQDPLQVTRISGGINFDGIPDDEVWKLATPLPMIMHIPIFGNEPTESSVVRICYDQVYLYASASMSYQDPSIIRAISKKRDYASWLTDWFGLVLDAFHDRQNAIMFFTNPNGIRTDAALKNDLTAGYNDVNFTWNTFWDVKSVRNESGWSCEIRIPFSSLRFQVRDGKTYMGIILLRYCAAKSETITYPPVSPEYLTAFWKPSLSATLVFEGLEPRNPVYLAPYLTAGLDQENRLNEQGTSYKVHSLPKYDAGLDAKYSISNNLTLDVTLNTDFAQVEADDQKINLSRFSLYFPEKRVFFQEKADVFDFSFLSGNNLFYSRKIGIYDGNPVRIYGGVRMTGRVKQWDVGILDMETAPFAANPGENFGVFRTKRTILNSSSYIGGMLTTRLGMNGSYNLAYGLDGQFRVKGDEYLTLRLAQTIENGITAKFLDPAPSRQLAQWERRNQQGFGYDILYSYSGEQFNPGIGFEVRENYQLVRAIARYGWFAGKEAAIRRQNLSLTAYNIWNTQTGLQETMQGLLTWYIEAKKGYSWSLSATWNREDVNDSIPLGNNQAFISPGRYGFSNLTVLYNTSSSHDLSGSFQADAGQFFDGWKISLGAFPILNVGTGLTMGMTYYFDYVNFPGRRVNFTNHIAGIRGTLTVTTKSSLSAFVQYNTAVNKVEANVRFRYNPIEGNDFYIVYNEGLNTALHRELPSLPYSYGRTILLKYTYTFRFTKK